MTPEEKNNLRFPGIKTEFVDPMKEFFPNATVTHAKNLKTGESVGKSWTEWMTEDGQHGSSGRWRNRLTNRRDLGMILSRPKSGE